MNVPRDGQEGQLSVAATSNPFSVRPDKRRPFKPPSSKRQQITAAEAIEIYKLRPVPGKGGQLRRGSMLHCKAIAPKYGVTPKTIRDVWSGRSWAKTTRHLWTEEEERRRGAGESEGDDHDDDGMGGAHGAATRAPPQGLVNMPYAGGDLSGLNASLMPSHFNNGNAGGNAGGMPGNFNNNFTSPAWFGQGNNAGGFHGPGIQQNYGLSNSTMGGNFGPYNMQGNNQGISAGMLDANGMSNMGTAAMTIGRNLPNLQMGANNNSSLGLAKGQFGSNINMGGGMNNGNNGGGLNGIGAGGGINGMGVLGGGMPAMGGMNNMNNMGGQAIGGHSVLSNIQSLPGNSPAVFNLGTSHSFGNQAMGTSSNMGVSMSGHGLNQGMPGLGGGGGLGQNQSLPPSMHALGQGMQQNTTPGNGLPAHQQAQQGLTSVMPAGMSGNGGGALGPGGQGFVNMPGGNGGGLQSGFNMNSIGMGVGGTGGLY